METQLLSSYGQDYVRARGHCSLCAGGDGVLGCAAPSGSTHPLGVPYPAHPPALWHRHLGLLQPVVEAPEVLGEEFGAYGLPIDADPLTYLHQVGRAAERPRVIRKLPSQDPQAAPYTRPIVRSIFWKNKSGCITVLLKTLLAPHPGLLGPSGTGSPGLCASPLLQPFLGPCAPAPLDYCLAPPALLPSPCPHTFYLQVYLCTCPLHRSQVRPLLQQRERILPPGWSGMLSGLL